MAKRVKKNQDVGKVFYSISFKYQNVAHMEHVYEYFQLNRLYSDFKFYRVSRIKDFLAIRHYNKYDPNSLELSIYKAFVLDWIK